MSNDDQGIEGLLFMLKDEKLSKRIPKIVIKQFEDVKKQLKAELFSEIEKIEKSISEIKQNSDPLIIEIINDLNQHQE